MLAFAREAPAAARADDSAKTAAWLLPVAEFDADPKIPTLEQVAGHAWGREISSHAEIERYCRALAEAVAVHGVQVHGGQLVLYSLISNYASRIVRVNYFSS